MKTLAEIFSVIGNNTGVDIGCNDKGGIHTYLETYEMLFESFRGGCTLLEIGLAMGDSLKLWDEYFTNSHIIGADISVVFEIPEYKNKVTIVEADGTAPALLSIINGRNLGEDRNIKFDIVIDDGSHMEADQIATFNMLKEHMNPGGVYIIEDILALDQNKHKFVALHGNCQIFDMRHNGRFDNVLIVYKF